MGVTEAAADGRWVATLLKLILQDRLHFILKTVSETNSNAHNVSITDLLPRGASIALKPTLI